MPLAKIFWTDTYYGSEDDYHEVVKDILPTFEAINEEQLEFVRKNLWHFKHPRNTGWTPRLIVTDEGKTIEAAIVSISAKLAEIEAAKAHAKEKREQKKLERVAKSKAARQMQYEKLKEEFGE